MKALIVGAGQAGQGILKHLVMRNHDVTVIDTSEQVLKNLSNQFDLRTVLGFGSFPEVMREAGAEKADILVAITSSDEINMIVCKMAHVIFNIPTKIARVRHQNYVTALQDQRLFQSELN